MQTRSEVMDLIIKASVFSTRYLNRTVSILALTSALLPVQVFAQHMHFHILPRWNADVNFMTAVANTRVIPESLEISWKKIRDAWNETP